MEKTGRRISVVYSVYSGDSSVRSFSLYTYLPALPSLRNRTESRVLKYLVT